MSFKTPSIPFQDPFRSTCNPRFTCGLCDHPSHAAHVTPLHGEARHHGTKEFCQILEKNLAAPPRRSVPSNIIWGAHIMEGDSAKLNIFRRTRANRGPRKHYIGLNDFHDFGGFEGVGTFQKPFQDPFETLSRPFRDLSSHPPGGAARFFPGSGKIPWYRASP